MDKRKYGDKMIRPGVDKDDRPERPDPAKKDAPAPNRRARP